MNDGIELDIITELVNIGIGEAAASLSDLTQRRVLIRTPEIKIMNVADISEYIETNMQSTGVYIAQDFEGPVTGKTILCYTQECSQSLINILDPHAVKTSSLTVSAMATLQEIGNIVMVSCITTIGDMMAGSLKFYMPSASLETSRTYFQNLIKDMEKFDKAIMVKNDMAIAQDKSDKTDKIEGYLFILLSFDHFEKVVVQLREKNLV